MSTGSTPKYYFPYPLASDSISLIASRIEQLAFKIEETYDLMGISYPLTGQNVLMQEGDPAGGDLTGTYPNPSIAAAVIATANLIDGSVTEPKLASNSVSTVKIQNDAVTTAKIDDAAVTNQKLAANSVTSNKILDGTIQAADLGANSVTTAKIADANVTSSKIQSNVDLDGSPTTTTQANTDNTTKIATTEFVQDVFAQSQGTAFFTHVQSTTNVHGIADTADLVATTDTGTVTSNMILDGTIVDDDINASAAIVDTKLDTISTAGKVANSATTGTETSTPDTLVLRDANADFDASLVGVRGVQFDNITPESDSEARLVWSADDGSLILGLEGGHVKLPLGQKHVIYAKNGTGSTINKMSAVMSVGAAGDRIDIDLAVADGSVAAQYMLGIAAENIADDTLGYVVTDGYVRNVNTDAWLVGTVLYFDPNTPGLLTSTAPTAPDLNLPVAIVTKKNSSSGILYVRMKTGEYLNELHDVVTGSPTDKDILEYNSLTGLWENASTLDDHIGDTQSVHGISDTANLVYTSDSRLSDARTPTAHAGSHESGGTDEIEIAPNQVTGTAVVDSDSRLTDARTPTAHATSHESGGSDELELAPSQITGTAVVDSDSRLTDARTPTAHASTHNPGQSDALDLTKIVGIGAALPTLPDSLYPAGSLFGVGSVAPYLLYRSTGSAWDQIGGAGGSSVTTDDTAPVSPSDGDLWYDSTTGKTFVWYEDGSSDQWVEVGTNGQLTIPLHGSDHVRGGSDIIDADRLTVDYVPSVYTRDSAASGAGDVTDLTAHLSGIDNTLAGYAPAYRNVIINGAMQVAQRATSVTGVTSSAYTTADRWPSGISNMGTWTVSVENDAPTGSGFSKSLKMLVTTADAAPAADDRCQLTQLIEGQNLQHFLKGTSSAKKFALSFWVKSNVTGTYICELYDQDNNRTVGASYTISSSATWEKKTIVFPADTTGAFDNDNGRSLDLRFWLGAGPDFTSGTLNTTWASTTNPNRAVGQTNLAAATNNYWQVTGVQLEPEVVTPFEFEPYETTVRKCQRYYEKSYNIEVPIHTNTDAGAVHHSGSGNGAGRHYVPVRFATTKRTTPTVTTRNIAGNSTAWETNNDSQTNLNRTPVIRFIGAGSFVADVEDGGYSWKVGNTRGHWMADAEL